MFGRPLQGSWLSASIRPTRCATCRRWIEATHLSSYGPPTRPLSSTRRVSLWRGNPDSGLDLATIRAKSKLEKGTLRSKDTLGSQLFTSVSPARAAASSQRPARQSPKHPSFSSRTTALRPTGSASRDDADADPEHWFTQKKALKKKFGESGWQPRKKISPDEMETVRDLHRSDPAHFSTEKLSQMYELSPEAIRRILKSRWRPTETEEIERQERWERRGEVIWASLAERGKKPPKKWRAKGIGLTDWEKKAAHRERLKLLGFDVPEMEPRPEQDPSNAKKRANKKQLPWDMESLKILKDSEENYGPSPLDDDSPSDIKSR